MGIDESGRLAPFWVAPGNGARPGAGSAENALRAFIVPHTLFWRLQTLVSGGGLIVDQVGLDLLILVLKDGPGQPPDL